MIKILLADPRHCTVGAHSNFVPINIGYIGSHLKEQLKDKHKIELELSTDNEEIFSLIKEAGNKEIKLLVMKKKYF